MKEFIDKDGKSWGVCLNVATVKRVREETGVDLLTLVDAEKKSIFEVLYRDYVLIARVLFAVCRDMADERKFSEEAFLALFAGDVIDRAVDALFAEMVDFFPSSRRALCEETKNFVLRNLREMQVIAVESVRNVDALPNSGQSEQEPQ